MSVWLRLFKPFFAKLSITPAFFAKFTVFYPYDNGSGLRLYFGQHFDSVRAGSASVR
jgi:hypothetical protein